jgi:hypothetical protein
MFLGNIVRMWQPFNGLQVYPAGVGKATEPEFVNIKGAQDRFQGIDSASHTACQTGTTTLFLLGS